MKESGKRVAFSTEKSSIMGVESERKKRQDMPLMVLARTKKAILRPPIVTANLWLNISKPKTSLPAPEKKAMITALTITNPAGAARILK